MHCFAIRKKTFRKPGVVPKIYIFFFGKINLTIEFLNLNKFDPQPPFAYFKLVLQPIWTSYATSCGLQIQSGWAACRTPKYYYLPIHQLFRQTFNRWEDARTKNQFKRGYKNRKETMECKSFSLGLHGMLTQICRSSKKCCWAWFPAVLAASSLHCGVPFVLQFQKHMVERRKCDHSQAMIFTIWTNNNYMDREVSLNWEWNTGSVKANHMEEVLRKCYHGQASIFTIWMNNNYIDMEVSIDWEWDAGCTGKPCVSTTDGHMLGPVIMVSEDEKEKKEQIGTRGRDPEDWMRRIMVECSGSKESQDYCDVCAFGMFRHMLIHTEMTLCHEEYDIIFC
ncbi:hypothetical protein VP01_747g3 [Puccinia sorghi]|uniref:Uncharacterized protein n=1 Tax=Puccinia sorghi TaxID=27349 RepID=A0A0L6UD81_9BASI|nr:hypothetical protein VP01_747g3 [Puccinia sorghi]